MPTIYRHVSPGDAVNTFINAKLRTLWQCMPGIVKAFNPSTGLADIVPVFQTRSTPESQWQDQVPLSGVPVVYHGGGNGRILIDPDVGDPCLLLWSQYGLSEWKNKRDETVPTPDGRVFQRSDAIAILGLAPAVEEGSYIKITDDNMVLCSQTVRLLCGDVDIPDIARAFISLSGTVNRVDADVRRLDPKVEALEAQVRALESRVTTLENG